MQYEGNMFSCVQVTGTISISQKSIFELGVNECEISTFEHSLIFNTECLNTHTMDTYCTNLHAYNDNFKLK